MQHTIKKNGLTNKLLLGFCFCLLLCSAQAAGPLWTFQPLTDTTVTVSSSGSATVQYQVTNQSRRPHTLVMTPISGITQVTTAGNCPSPFTLSYQQSCSLTLEVNGDALQGNVLGGPVLCQQGSTLQCYQPSAPNSLHVKLMAEPGTTTLTPLTQDLVLSMTRQRTILRMDSVIPMLLQTLRANIQPRKPV